MIVEEIRIRGATIRVHDDSYVNRTKEPGYGDEIPQIHTDQNPQENLK